MAVHLGSDTNKVGANGGIVCLRPNLPLEQGYSNGDSRRRDNSSADDSANDTAGARVGRNAVFIHIFSP
jgi:hypothetical protein